MKIILSIGALVILVIAINKIKQKHFEKKYNIYEPQRYKVFFGGVSLEPLILYASTKDIADKISYKYMFGFDTCNITELTDEQIKAERKAERFC